MEDLLRVLGPYLAELGVLLVAVVAAAVLFVVGRAIKKNTQLAAWLKENEWLLDVASDVVVRVAFHPTTDELILYKDEAERTGRDLRLVIAYHELAQLAAERGIKVDEARLIGLIEQIYQDLVNDPDTPTLAAAPPLWRLEEQAQLERYQAKRVTLE